MPGRHPFRAVALALVLGTGAAYVTQRPDPAPAVPRAAEAVLSLPPNLVDLRSPEGRRLLAGSEVSEAFLPLSVNFVTQRNQAFCGVASIVMVLNALGVPAPTTPEYAPHRMFTQENLLDDRTEAILPRAVLERQGMNLKQLGRLLALHPVEVDVRPAGSSSLEEFRALAVSYLGRPDHHVLVNYLRRAIGQERDGHISPLAAYDAETDRFLVLDVSRYKYPPVWVPAAELFDAMNTVVDRQGRTRGFVLVRKPAEQTAVAARAN